MPDLSLSLADCWAKTDPLTGGTLPDGEPATLALAHSASWLQNSGGWQVNALPGPA